MRKKLYHQFACSSLILPKHRAGLIQHHRKKIREEDLRSQPAPVDEQQLEQFQHLVKRSMHSGQPLKITFLDSDNYHIFTGVIAEQQPESGRLRFRCEKQALTIPITAIISVEPASSRSK